MANTHQYEVIKDNVDGLINDFTRKEYLNDFKFKEGLALLIAGCQPYAKDLNMTEKEMINYICQKINVDPQIIGD